MPLPWCLRCPPAAFWDATRAFMLLAVLSCFAGVVLGLSAFTNGTKNKRVRTGGIALLLSGNARVPSHFMTCFVFWRAGKQMINGPVQSNYMIIEFMFIILHNCTCHRHSTATTTTNLVIL